MLTANDITSRYPFVEINNGFGYLYKSFHSKKLADIDEPLYLIELTENKSKQETDIKIFKRQRLSKGYINKIKFDGMINTPGEFEALLYQLRILPL